jgi:hypothetical protein
MPYIKFFKCDGSKTDETEVRTSLLTLGSYVRRGAGPQTYDPD